MINFSGDNNINMKCIIYDMNIYVRRTQLHLILLLINKYKWNKWSILFYFINNNNRNNDKYL